MDKLLANKAVLTLRNIHTGKERVIDAGYNVTTPLFTGLLMTLGTTTGASLKTTPTSVITNFNIIISATLHPSDRRMYLSGCFNEIGQTVTGEAVRRFVLATQDTPAYVLIRQYFPAPPAYREINTVGLSRQTPSSGSCQVVSYIPLANPCTQTTDEQLFIDYRLSFPFISGTLTEDSIYTRDIMLRAFYNNNITAIYTAPQSGESNTLIVLPTLQRPPLCYQKDILPGAWTGADALGGTETVSSINWLLRKSSRTLSTSQNVGALAGYLTMQSHDGGLTVPVLGADMSAASFTGSSGNFTFSPPFHPIFGHSGSNLDPNVNINYHNPHYDSLLVASSPGYPRLQGQVNEDIPMMFMWYPTETGSFNGTAKYIYGYTYTGGYTNGFAGVFLNHNLFIGRQSDTPNSTMPSLPVWQHIQKAEDTNYPGLVKEIDTNYRRFLKTLSVKEVLAITGNAFTLLRLGKNEKNEDPLVVYITDGTTSATDIIQVEVDKENRLIYLACFATGTWLVNLAGATPVITRLDSRPSLGVSKARKQGQTRYKIVSLVKNLTSGYDLLEFDGTSPTVTIFTGQTVNNATNWDNNATFGIYFRYLDINPPTNYEGIVCTKVTTDSSMLKFIYWVGGNLTLITYGFDDAMGTPGVSIVNSSLRRPITILRTSMFGWNRHGFLLLLKAVNGNSWGMASRVFNGASNVTVLNYASTITDPINVNIPLISPQGYVYSRYDNRVIDVVNNNGTPSVVNIGFLHYSSSKGQYTSNTSNNLAYPTIDYTIYNRNFIVNDLVDWLDDRGTIINEFGIQKVIYPFLFINGTIRPNPLAWYLYEWDTATSQWKEYLPDVRALVEQTATYTPVGRPVNALNEVHDVVAGTNNLTMTWQSYNVNASTQLTTNNWITQMVWEGMYHSSANSTYYELPVISYIPRTYKEVTITVPASRIYTLPESNALPQSGSTINEFYCLQPFVGREFAFQFNNGAFINRGNIRAVRDTTYPSAAETVGLDPLSGSVLFSSADVGKQVKMTLPYFIYGENTYHPRSIHENHPGFSGIYSNTTITSGGSGTQVTSWGDSSALVNNLTPISTGNGGVHQASYTPTGANALSAVTFTATQGLQGTAATPIVRRDINVRGFTIFLLMTITTDTSGLICTIDDGEATETNTSIKINYVSGATRRTSLMLSNANTEITLTNTLQFPSTVNSSWVILAASILPFQGSDIASSYVSTVYTRNASNVLQVNRISATNTTHLTTTNVTSRSSAPNDFTRLRRLTLGRYRSQNGAPMAIAGVFLRDGGMSFTFQDDFAMRVFTSYGMPTTI